jgi:hydroxymethylbilane synthase
VSAALRLGTRRSTLALTQSQWVADAITKATGVPVELVHIVTEGDRSSAAIAQLGGTGVFVAAIRRALQAGEVDLAVHSYKDLPTAAEPGLTLAAVPQREDPRDALVARDGLTLGELPAGARVGTGAPRRVAQLRALGLGLEVVPIRGNVDTRMGRVAPGDLDAVVLARAGLSRLGRVDAITETLDPLQVLPAPAQGALAVECRTSDARTRELLSPLEHPATRACVLAERATLAALEAGCTAPVAAYAEVADGETGPELFLRASVTALDGSDAVRGSLTGPLDDAAALGRALAAELLDRGAAELMAVPAEPHDPSSQTPAHALTSRARNRST